MREIPREGTGIQSKREVEEKKTNRIRELQTKKRSIAEP